MRLRVGYEAVTGILYNIVLFNLEIHRTKRKLCKVFHQRPKGSTSLYVKIARVWTQRYIRHLTYMYMCMQHEDDTQSVHLFVGELQMERYNPILGHKPQGKLDPDLTQVSFFLAIQTEHQCTMYASTISAMIQHTREPMNRKLPARLSCTVTRTCFTCTHSVLRVLRARARAPSLWTAELRSIRSSRFL